MEIGLEVDQTTLKFIDLARQMEAFFIQKRFLLSALRPELILKEENLDLRLEIGRKEELIKKHYDRIETWRLMLSDHQQAHPQTQNLPQSIGPGGPIGGPISGPVGLAGPPGPPDMRGMPMAGMAIGGMPMPGGMGSMGGMSGMGGMNMPPNNSQGPMMSGPMSAPMGGPMSVPMGNMPNNMQVSSLFNLYASNCCLNMS